MPEFIFLLVVLVVVIVAYKPGFSDKESAVSHNGADFRIGGDPVVKVKHSGTHNKVLIYIYDKSKVEIKELK